MSRLKILVCRLSFVLLSLMYAVAAEESPEKPVWKMVKGDLVTRWAGEVSPDHVLPEYPRPLMQRRKWKNLNGLWEFTIQPVRAAGRPDRFDDHILVPFSVASALSGVKKVVTEKDRLWYRRAFHLPAAWRGRAILLHFGAADWETTVWINGREATHHRGGYDPFCVDITDMLKKTAPQEVIVSVWDPSDKGPQMRGKQVIKPHGFNYTGVSGIWQTVWIEPVPVSYIRSVYTEPDIDENCVWVTVDTENTNDGYSVEVRTFLPETGQEKGSIPVVAEERAGRRLRLRLRREPKTRLWSPDSPFLYDLLVTLKDRNGRALDRVQSYFGMRTIAVGKDADGINRFLLNNKPLFQYGFLDQGWWPDGLYTAPTDAALRYDIETAKRIGANMVRKHVKIESQRFYFWCDRLGILVWQDMPNGTNHTREFKRQYEVELKRNIDALRGHPSIVMWVAFNEGWGQFDAPRHAEWIKHYDPSRLVDHASGWADRGEFGDVRDIHIYPEPGVAPVREKRAIVLGEFGGIGWSVPGHEWRAEEVHGHGGRRPDDADLTEPYLRLIRKLPAMKRLGLCGACYTQIADQEIEVNGVMSYDREILKFDAEKALAETLKLYDAPPQVKRVLPTSQVDPQTWSYTTETPEENWFKPDFDDSAWKKGPGGFGDFHPTFPMLIVPPRTKWTGSDIWIRRTFKLESTDFFSPCLLIHHDETAKVYLNGQLVRGLHHTSNFYTWYPMNETMVNALKTGVNTIAVHCHNEHHPQYIDVGIVDVRPNKVKVFILAGQSNMEGHGDLRSLPVLGEHPEYGYLLKKLQNEDGSWAVRDDVTVAWKVKEKKHGPLTVGWGGSEKEIGPELMFGTIMGEKYKEPVLLIKTAWGGKDVYCDFRSPGAGRPAGAAAAVLEKQREEGGRREIGKYYRMMIADVKETLNNIETIIPGCQGQGYEIAGFAWFQGWNDFCAGHDVIAQYPKHLAAMFRDLRRDLGVPDLPIVIGELGIGGNEIAERAKKYEDDFEANGIVKLRAAQKAVGEDPAIKNVTFVPTADFWDVRLQELREISNAYWAEKQKKGIKDSEENHLPTKELNDEFLRRGVNWYCHYNGSSSNYSLIGYALAETLNRLNKISQ